MTTERIDRVQFVQNNIPTRLKNLAAHLAEINLLSRETEQPFVAIRLIRESQYFRRVDGTRNGYRHCGRIGRFDACFVEMEIELGKYLL